MLIKASSINNLSDARYFNALENIFIGLNFDALHQHHISLQLSHSIISWLFEPKIIAEFGLHQTKEEIDYILNEIDVAGIQIPYINRSIYNDYKKIKFLQTNEQDKNIICNPTDFLIVSAASVIQISPSLFIQTFIELSHPSDIKTYNIDLSDFAGISIANQNLNLIDEWNDFLESIN